MKRVVVFFLSMLSAINAAELNLVWQCHHWEEDWLTELLADNFTVNHIEDGKYATFINNSIIVISAHTDRQALLNYFSKLINMQYKFGVIHLSDELYKSPRAYYPYAQFVFRNYWHKIFKDQKNVYAFPLGYKAGFWQHRVKAVTKLEDRQYTWSFAGSFPAGCKQTRHAMIETLKQVPMYHIHQTGGMQATNNLSVAEYQNLLLNTLFVPCPTGWANLDSFRVYEALECGCIPIVEKVPLDYFRKFYGDYPFLAVTTWDQAPALINDLMNSPEKLKEMQQACQNWWFARKEKVKKEFRDIIYNSGIVSPGGTPKQDFGNHKIDILEYKLSSRSFLR